MPPEPAAWSDNEAPGVPAGAMQLRQNAAGYILPSRWSSASSVVMGWGGQPGM